MIDFIRRWHRFGGGSARDIIEEFGIGDTNPRPSMTATGTVLLAADEAGPPVADRRRGGYLVNNSVLRAPIPLISVDQQIIGP